VVLYIVVACITILFHHTFLLRLVLALFIVHHCSVLFAGFNAHHVGLTKRDDLTTLVLTYLSLHRILKSTLPQSNGPFKYFSEEVDFGHNPSILNLLLIDSRRRVYIPVFRSHGS
jgi:hypothetical protein